MIILTSYIYIYIYINHYNHPAFGPALCEAHLQGVQHRRLVQLRHLCGRHATKGDSENRWDVEPSKNHGKTIGPWENHGLY